jgi:hypothetical protein
VGIVAYYHGSSLIFLVELWMRTRVKRVFEAKRDGGWHQRQLRLDIRYTEKK